MSTRYTPKCRVSSKKLRREKDFAVLNKKKAAALMDVLAAVVLAQQAFAATFAAGACTGRLLQQER